MNQKEFDQFFKVHSANVDNSIKQGFWALTDAIIKTYLLDNIKKRDSVTIVDFGGGTGRWLLMLDEYFTDSNFVIVDKSTDMLSQAKRKIDSGLYKNKVKLIEADISNITSLSEASVDYIISTYNPLSFVADPQAVIDEAYRILKAGGIALITVQGYYNALYSKVNNFFAEANELKTIFSYKKVKWNESIPGLLQLPKKDMEAMFKNAGFEDISSRGIACIAQPQAEDFDPENIAIGKLSKKLNEDPEFYRTLLEIELATGQEQNAVDRGMNILTMGVKN